MEPLLGEIGLATLLALSGATAAWFFPARRYMIELEKSVVEELEEGLRPVDVEYKLLGLYVGFHAVYKVEGLRWVKALLVLIPRHALLYLPIVKARGEHDIVVVEAAPRGGVIHKPCLAYKKLTRSIKRQLERIGVEPRARPCPEKLARLLRYQWIYAVWSTPDTVGVAGVPEPGGMKKALRELVEVAKSL